MPATSTSISKLSAASSRSARAAIHGSGGGATGAAGATGAGFGAAPDGLLDEGGFAAASAIDGELVDLLLEFHDGADQRVRPRRAAHRVDVDGEDAVDAGHDGVVAVETSRRRAD